MNGFRAYWNDEAAEIRDRAPGFHTVSRVAPPRPRWGHLYVAVAMVGILGTAGHFMVHDSVLLEIVDAVFAFGLFASLASWVHFNRIALTRMNEPDAGIGRPRLRIVRVRRDAAQRLESGDGVVRLEPGDRVILPYDFR